MDDFAHLLLGYVVFRFLRIFGVRAGKPELAVILVASILPDPIWFFGLASYAAAHTLTAYILVALPFAAFARTRLAAIWFGMGSALHILIDAIMHARATVLFAPLSGFSITGTFNYWEVWWGIPAYWLAILALLCISLYLEKKKTGRLTAA